MASGQAVVSGKRAGRRLREDRRSADHEGDEPAEGRQMSDVLHGCPRLV